MSKMKELDLCIQEVSQGDAKLYQKLSNEVQCYLEGLIGLERLSTQALTALQSWGTGCQNELSNNAGRFSFKDLPLFSI